MSIAGIARSVLADQVKDHLLKEILNGRYPPDSRIVETGVARELGTSQAPVREALRALEAIGVVEIEPFRGARVRRPSVDELLQAYVVRSDLETLAARLGVPSMTETDLAELLGLAEEMQRAAAARDGHAVAIADAAFHARIVRLAGNSVLERVWQNLEPFLRTYLTLLVPGADPQWSADLHNPITEALRRGETAEVAAAIEQHFAEAGAMVARSWPEAEPEGMPPHPADTDHD
jgi:DNA-binding GntR family transcriptional regulator